MIDSHCHFDLPEFDTDRTEVWQRAKSHGAESLLIPATELHNFEKIKDLAKTFSEFYYALGFHPWFLNASSLELLSHLQDQVGLAKSERQFVAIGETGLDFAQDVVTRVPVELQEKCFIFQIELALSLDLPIIIHHRKSHNRIIQILKNYPKLRGVIHAFSGSEYEANTYAEMGFKLGIGGTITYERSQKTRRAIKSVGIEHLLLETDAPSMPLYGKQGQRNSPEYLSEVAEHLSHTISMTTDEIAQNTSTSFYKLFLNN